MAELLFRSLLTLSLGSLLALPFISVREIGRGFFTLWVAIVGSLGTIGLALLASHGLGGAPLGAASAAPGSSATSAAPDPGGEFAASLLGLSLALLMVFWIALRMGLPRCATVALLASALCGGLVLRELALSGPSTPRPVDTAIAAPAWIGLRVSNLLLSALSVGMVTVAMVLGHWYLVQPKLALAPLRRCCNVLLGVLLARLIVSGWGMAESIQAGHAFFARTEPIPWEIVILSQRLLFGFGGSLILAVMIRKTVALRSTMSATGLLYIAILFVWVGEFLSIYLGRLTGGSLVV